MRDTVIGVPWGGASLDSHWRSWPLLEYWIFLRISSGAPWKSSFLVERDTFPDSKSFGKEGESLGANSSHQAEAATHWPHFILHSAWAPERKSRGSSPAVDTEGCVECLMSYGSKRCALLCFREMETCPRYILTSQYSLPSGSAPNSLDPSQSRIHCTLGPCASPNHIRAELSPTALALCTFMLQLHWGCRAKGCTHCSRWFI